jgi:hypothetical protein
VCSHNDLATVIADLRLDAKCERSAERTEETKCKEMEGSLMYLREDPQIDLVYIEAKTILGQPYVLM